MGSRKVCIWPSNKTVSLVLILCSVAFSLLPLVSDAKTFVFKSTKQPANYSDTANWVNLDYPGRIISAADSVFFSKSIYDTANLDSSLNISGHIIIGDSMNMQIPGGVTITILGMPGTWMETLLTSAATSFLRIDGVMNIYHCAARFDGKVLVNGLLRSDAELYQGLWVWQALFFSRLTVNGIFSGVASKVYFDTLHNSSTGYLNISSGYNFYASELNGEFLLNEGVIYLSAETGMRSDSMVNAGSIRANYIAGNLNNSGEVTVIGYVSHSFTASIGYLVNTGSISFSGDTLSPVNIQYMQNALSMELSGVVFIQQEMSNSGNCNLKLSGSTSSITANTINTGNMYVQGRITFANGSVTNQGLMDFSKNSSSGVKITNTFFNYGTLNLKGVMEIANDFYQSGILQLEGPIKISGHLYQSGKFNVYPLPYGY